MPRQKRTKSKPAPADTSLTLADLEEQIREVAEATSRATSHLDVKKGELKLKALRSLVELVNHREELRADKELGEQADRLERMLAEQNAPADLPFDAPESPLPDDLGFPVPKGHA